MFSKHPWWAITIYIIATLFLIYEMALQVSPSVMTKDLMRDFAIGAGKLGLMGGFYFYSYTLMQIPAGLLVDRFGPRRLITLSAIVCSLGAFFFGGTQTYTMACLGRFFMGFGSAFAFICVLVVASRWFQKKSFALLVGMAQFLAAMGALSGELPLSYAIDTLGSRHMMMILAALGMVIALIALIFVRDYPQEATPTHHQDRHLKLWHKLAEILTHKQTYAIGAYAFCSWAPVAAFAALWGVPFMIELYQISNTHAALAIAMVWLGCAFSAPFLGWVSDLLGRRCLPLQVAAIIGTFCSAMVIYLPLPFWLACVLLIGLGVAGSGQIVTFALVQETNRPSMTGAAIGFNNMAVVAGGAIFQPLIGWILHSLWNGQTSLGIPIYSVNSYKFALMLIPLCFATAWILSTFFIEETFCKTITRKS